jgi:hypothetical protein
MNTTYTQDELLENLIASGNHTQASAKAALQFLTTYTEDANLIAAKEAILKQATTPAWMQPETLFELENELETSEFLQGY